eukprot:8436044-Pyramimonas_sp.AAC.1
MKVRRPDRAPDGNVTPPLKRNGEEEREAYRRCKTARRADLRVMLAGPKGREVGGSGELDKAVRTGDGSLGCCVHPCRD